MQSLLSTNTRVEVPFIVVKIGDYSFGLYNRTKANVEIAGRYYLASAVTYPNYMQSLVVNKVNGALNTYTLTMVYPITATDDPNLIDKILSSVSRSRKIIFTYGDCATPSFMYKNEEALITKVKSNVDISNSKITYTITAVSAAIAASAGTFNFPKYTNKKPSDIIKSILYNKQYGLQDVFYGMHDKQRVEQLGLILSDDKEVTIEAQRNITVLNYLDYLVANMASINDSTTSIKKTARYVLTIHDDTSGILDGPYFRVTKVVNSIQSNSSIDMYTIDIGYPNKDITIAFTVDNNEAYSILYDYSQKLNTSNYVYRIGDEGSIYELYSPAISNSAALLKTTEYDKTWWSQMTQYPIKATLRIKGLLRAAVLMSYLRVNVYFYGKKHTSSGVYVITKQVDEVTNSGYATTLSLVRISEDGQI